MGNIINPYRFAGFTPTDIASLQGWWHMDDSTITGTTNVTNVTDLSGNANDLTGSLGSLETSVLNSMDVLQGLDADGAIYDFGVNAPAAFTVMMVVRHLSGGAFGRIWDCSSGNANCQFSNSAQGLWDRTQSGSNQTWVQTVADWSIMSFKFVSNSSAIFYVDGTQVASFDPDNVYQNGLIRFMGALVGSDMQIAEAAYFNAALSDGDRGDMESYMNTEWNLGVL